MSPDEGAYPIHPELFDRLYNDWSTLDKFQRTRGVLRLMSAVSHALWEREDKGLMILPASVPVDAPAVQSELTRYLQPGDFAAEAFPRLLLSRPCSSLGVPVWP